MRCRHCHEEVDHVFLDLGVAPPSNAYLSEADLHGPEVYYPLRVRVCHYCWLVQTEDYARHDSLFSPNYAYFSSTSRSWLAHAKSYVEAIVPRLHLDRRSMVVEIAANDGYLLQYVKERNIPCLGIEPTHSTAQAAKDRGIPVIEEFFGEALASRMLTAHRPADLIIANNVLAHVPDINDFVAGIKTLLSPTGTATVEFPHLLNLLRECQFDTVYHEHFSYLGLGTVKRIFERFGLSVYDVERLPTHGGSLRVYAGHAEHGWSPSERLGEVLEAEIVYGLQTPAPYEALQQQAERIKNELLEFLLSCKKQNRKVIGYGAAAKGNTLLNFAGVKPDLLPIVVDAAPSKQGKYLPGSRIPIVDERIISEQQPDFILIFPWNLRAEISHQLSYINQWGGAFVTAVPQLAIAAGLVQ